MSPAGRPRKSTALHLLAGNPGKRALPKNEPPIEVKRPRIPSGMSKGARAEWKRIVPLLERMRVLTLEDRATVQAYCEHYDRFVQASRQVEREGMTFEIEDAQGNICIRRHPATQVMDAATGRMLAAAIQLGITPSSRSKVSAIDSGGKKAKDLW